MELASDWQSMDLPAIDWGNFPSDTSYAWRFLSPSHRSTRCGCLFSQVLLWHHTKPDKAKVASSPAARRNATSEKSESYPISLSPTIPIPPPLLIYVTFVKRLLNHSFPHLLTNDLHHARAPPSCKLSGLIKPEPLNTANRVERLGRASTTSTWTSQSSQENASWPRAVWAGVPLVAAIPLPLTAATSATPSGVAPPKDTS